MRLKCACVANLFPVAAERIPTANHTLDLTSSKLCFTGTRTADKELDYHSEMYTELEKLTRRNNPYDYVLSPNQADLGNCQCPCLLGTNPCGKAPSHRVYHQHSRQGFCNRC